MPIKEATKSKFLPSLRTGRILIAEGDEDTREAIALALRQEGYEVLLVDNGTAALDLIQPVGSNETGEEVDLLVTDLTLPHVNGLDLCRILRSRGSNLPVLIISSRTTETDVVVGLEVGADDYLKKPFSVQELVARCRALLRGHRQVRSQPHQMPQAALHFKDITLHPDACRVFLKGKEVTLSPKEFRLLELFMTHPKRVWEREQLIQRVWGEDFVGDTKTVDVHIRWLREKLEDEPSRPQYVITLRGFGYRFG